MTLSNEKMLKIENLFGYDDKVCAVAEDVIDRLDDETTAYDVSEKVWDCVGDALMYTEDRWAMIEHYSSPESPIDINEACNEFAGELITKLEEIL